MMKTGTMLSAMVVVVSLLSLHCEGVAAETPGELLWSKTYGYGKSDGVYAIDLAVDQGFVAGGYTQSKGSGDAKVWGLKLDANGTLIWDKYFGQDNAPAFGYAVKATPDGGCILAGETRIYNLLDEFNLTASYRYSMDVIKLSAAGSKQWEKRLGGPDYDRANAVITTRDGGYIVAGHTQSYAEGYNPPPHAKKNIWIVKLTSSGTKEWEVVHGGPQGDGINSVVQTADNGFIAAGFTASQGEGSYDCFVIKLGPRGAIEWEKTYGGPRPDKANCIVQTLDGGYVVAGETWSFGMGKIDCYLLKLRPDGTVEWSNTYGGPGYERAFSIRQMQDGGYLTAGSTDSYGAGGRDAWLVRTDARGGFLWSRTYGGASCDEASSIALTPDGGYVVAGSTSSQGGGEIDAWVMKFGKPALVPE